MVKFLATHTDNNRKILGLGLVQGNINLLIKGNPIHINAEQMGLLDIKVNEILIFFGETEEQIKKDFELKGILENTKILIDKADKQ